MSPIPYWSLSRPWLSVCQESVCGFCAEFHLVAAGCSVIVGVAGREDLAAWGTLGGGDSPVIEGLAISDSVSVTFSDMIGGWATGCVITGPLEIVIGSKIFGFIAEPILTTTASRYSRFTHLQLVKDGTILVGMFSLTSCQLATSPAATPSLTSIEVFVVSKCWLLPPSLINIMRSINLASTLLNGLFVSLLSSSKEKIICSPRQYTCFSIWQRKRIGPERQQRQQRNFSSVPSTGSRRLAVWFKSRGLGITWQWNYCRKINSKKTLMVIDCIGTLMKVKHSCNN